MSTVRDTKKNDREKVSSQSDESNSLKNPTRTTAAATRKGNLQSVR